MKKSSLHKPLRLTKQSIAVLTRDQVRAAAGARPPILPESWFECTFTLYHCD